MRIIDIVTECHDMDIRELMQTLTNLKMHPNWDACIIGQALVVYVSRFEGADKPTQQDLTKYYGEQWDEVKEFFMEDEQ